MRFRFGLALAITTLGCGHVGVTRLGAGSPATPKPGGCKLDVYTSEAEVKRSFEALCLIDATRGTANSMEGAIDWTRDDAWQCGADAVVFMSGSVGGIFHRAEATVKAIRYTGPYSAPVPAPGPSQITGASLLP